MPVTISNHAFPSPRLSSKATVRAGLVAGLVFLLIEMLVPLFAGASVWGPPRMMAAIAMGRDVLPPPVSFAPAVVAVALLVHATLSLVYAAVFATGLSFIPKGRAPLAATLLGAGFGLLLYLVNFYGFSVWFPWFAEARGGVQIIAHIVFGAVLAASYVAFLRRDTNHTGHQD